MGRSRLVLAIDSNLWKDELFPSTAPGREKQEQLQGREIRVDGLARTLRDVIVRVRFADGRRANALLRGTRPVFVVPLPPEHGLGTLPAKLRDAVWSGIGHALLDPLHVLLALTVGLAGGWSMLGRVLGAFLGANLVGLALLSLAVAVPPALGEAAVGIGAVLAARMALSGEPRRLAAVAVVAGLAHGAALGSAWSSLESVAVSLGIDTTHLVVGAAAVALRAAVRSPRALGFSAYATGVAAVACIAIAASRPTPSSAQSSGLSSLPTLGADQVAGAIAPTAPPLGLKTELAAYLDVGPFETRFEILAQLPALDKLLGLGVGDRGTVEVAEQEPLLELASAALSESLGIEAWPMLPEAIRAGIVAMAKAASCTTLHGDEGRE